MKNFYLIPNMLKDLDLEITRSIIDYLNERGCDVFLPKDLAENAGGEWAVPIDDNRFESTECAIVLGGDGTIIHSARQLAQHDIPILGVNLGSLGFLAAIEEHAIFETLDAILEDRYVIENRMMLEADIYKGGKVIQEGFALNDIVVSRMALSRMVRFSIYINDRFVNDYSADGVIVTTPTGSTAYNLSAGGPILEPQTEMMAITPICPHSLSTRSIVISCKDEVRITFEKNRSAWHNDLIITIDGQTGIQIDNDMELVIKRSGLITRLVNLHGHNFFTLLRRKLGKN